MNNKTLREYIDLIENKDILKFEEVGGFKVVLKDTGFGYQVRIYYSNGELYDTGLSKNSLDKGIASFDETVSQLKKQLNTKD